jgi:PhoPQ-activated pathogenicity-related protein
MMKRAGGRWSLLPSCLGLLVACGSAARADLAAYVKKHDPAFAWQLKAKTDRPDGTVYDLHLVSQVWEGITWEHQLQVYQPKGVKPRATMLLWNTGGQAKPDTIAFGMDLAKRSGAPCAFLYNIPNQPLFGGKTEDGLIAETFVRYLKTRDEDWPLLFPMVKSVVRAMDALQDFGKRTWHTQVEHFVVSGASKRGWTTWLTATVEPRVKAIAPLVIDTLNMGEQGPHQLAAFGKYSEQIKDYTERRLVPAPDTAASRRLWRMVDPYTYRDKLTLPKLLINGNNDPYWTVDALNLYWDGLKGPKWVEYVPNAGHNLRQRLADGREDHARAVATLAAFVHCKVFERAIPKLRWTHDDAGGKLRLTVVGDPAPRSARLWVAHARTQDFRQAAWVERALRLEGGKVVGAVARPAEGYVAFYAELDYAVDGLAYHLSTQLRVAGPRMSTQR